MSYPLRLVLSLAITAVFATRAGWAAEDPSMAPPTPPAEAPKPVTTHAPAHPPALAEYKRADANAYPKAALLKSRPGAVVLPKSKFEARDGSFFFQPKVRAPKELFLETTSDWIEPITPPDMPASLGVPSNAMQIREPQGDVVVAVPAAPGNFSVATDGMILPNGSVIKTGTNGTAAVLFGGVASARLMPNSAAAVQQTVTAESRAAEVDLTTGGVFSKVGTQVGVKGTYRVHTANGDADCSGGDFVTIMSGGRIDVLAAQGTVNLVDSTGAKIGTVVSIPNDLKWLGTPTISDLKQSLQAEVATLTAALNFIPLANQKVKGLREKLAGNETLTENQKAYLNRIKQVPYLIMLDVVAPPPPVVAAPVEKAAAPFVAPKPAEPTKPLKVVVHPDGSVRFHGATTDMTTFENKIAEIGKATPQQAFVVSAAADVPADKVQAVQDALHTANFQNVTLHVAPAPSVPATPPKVATPVAATPADNADLPTPLMSAPTLSPADHIVPLEIDMHARGKLVMEGQAVTIEQLKTRLADIAHAIPNQSVVIRKDPEASGDQLKDIMSICRGLKLKVKAVKIAPSVPAVPATTAPVTTPNPLAPGLRMNPTMQISSDPAPITHQN